jgi:glyoxylase-like metal-dependent hydrolase (beta-lactamase superfamily II)
LIIRAADRTAAAKRRIDMPTQLSDVAWIHGAADCRANADPLLQVYRFDPDTFIMRENKCYSAEGNFIYLLLGARRALLLDTGDGQDADSLLPRTDLPLAQTVRGILAERQRPLDLVVAHTHSHGDHVAWDGAFRPEPRTTVVGLDRTSIMQAFGLSDWPDSRAVFDLGGRQLDVFPIPGHEPHHIAFYDRNTRILLTGDMLYPGVLTVPVPAWEDYRQSAARLAQFAGQNPVSLVLGAHIEAKNAPRQFYQPQTPFQPDEQVLPLGVQHVRELHQACQAIGPNPRTDIHDDFVIEPL